MNTLDRHTELYASVLRQLLPVGGYDRSPDTLIAKDIYAHAKALAQADLDAKRLLGFVSHIPVELISEYENELGLPLKCSVNSSKTVEERLALIRWIQGTKNVFNINYVEQIFNLFGVTLLDLKKYVPMQCTGSCSTAVNTEQLRFKVKLKLQKPVGADMPCIIQNYLPAFLRIDIKEI